MVMTLKTDRQTNKWMNRILQACARSQSLTSSFQICKHSPLNLCLIARSDVSLFFQQSLCLFFDSQQHLSLPTNSDACFLNNGPPRFLVNKSEVISSPLFHWILKMSLSFGSRRKCCSTFACLVPPPTVQLLHALTAPLLSTSKRILAAPL